MHGFTSLACRPSAPARLGHALARMVWRRGMPRCARRPDRPTGTIPPDRSARRRAAKTKHPSSAEPCGLGSPHRAPTHCPPAVRNREESPKSRGTAARWPRCEGRPKSESERGAPSPRRGDREPTLHPNAPENPESRSPTSPGGSARLPPSTPECPRPSPPRRARPELRIRDSSTLGAAPAGRWPHRLRTASPRRVRADDEPSNRAAQPDPLAK